VYQEAAYSIGHYYPVVNPYHFQPYHVLREDVPLTLGFSMGMNGETAEEAEQILRDIVDSSTLLITVNGYPLENVDAGYLWEYISVEYDTGSGEYSVRVMYRYYLDPQPPGEYEIYWRLEIPEYGVWESVGHVVWVKG
jgi:hypothetical protein